MDNYQHSFAKCQEELEQARAEISRLQQELAEVRRIMGTHAGVTLQGIPEQELLITLVNSLPDYIYIKDEQGRFVVTNQALAKLVGADPVAMLGKTDFDFFPEELAREFYNDEQNLILQGKTILHQEERSLDAQGNPRWTVTTKIPLKDLSGKVIGLIGQGQDITEQRRVWEDLQRTQAQLSEALKVAQLVYWEFDLQTGEFIHNDDFYASLGTTAEQEGGYRMPAMVYAQKFIHPEDAPSVAAQITESLAPSSTISTMENTVRTIRKDGTVRIIISRVKIERDAEGRPVHVFGANQDITDTKKAEEIIAKSAKEMATVSEVSRMVTTIQNPDEMMQAVVDLTKQAFDLYHAHVYLTNTAGDSLTLAKGSGEVGRQMVAEGRHIALSAERSLVARAARTREAVIVNDVRQTPDFLPHPLLPETRSEMAIPMLVNDKLLGVLDIQSRAVDRFSSEDIKIYVALTSQVTVALQNARQYAQVQESERLIRTVIDSTPDWIFIKDQAHRFRLVNQGYANSMHIQPEDVVGKDDLELGFPEELVKGNPEKGIAGFWADDRAVMDSGEVKVIPHDIVMIDGQLRVLNTLKTPLHDENGKVWGVLAFARDVTEREQILQDLETQRRTLQAVLDNMPAGVFMVEAPSGKVLLSNKKTEEFLGRGVAPDASSDEYNQVYQTYKYGTDDLYPAEEMPIVAGMSGLTRTIDDMEVRRPDGTRILLQVTGAPVYGPDDQVVASVVLFQDITELRKATDEARRTELLYRQILDSIVDMILVKGPKSNIIWANKAFRETYGMSNDQLKNMIDAPIVEPDLTQKYIQDDMWVFENGKNLFIPEEPIVRYDGVVLPVETVKSPIFDESGKVSMTVGVFRDITESKKAQETIAKRAVELEKVSSVATIVAKIQTPDEMLQAVVDLTKEGFDLYHAHIYLLNDNGDQLVLTKGSGEIGHQMVAEGREISMDTEKSLVARAARVRQGVVVNDVRQDPEFLPHPLLSQTRSELAVPMVVGDTVLGVMDIQSEQVGRFSHEDISIMTTLASQVAVALQNARSFARAQQQAEREALINAISERIQSTNSVEDALQVAVRELGRALGAQRTAIQLGLNPKGNGKS